MIVEKNMIYKAEDDPSDTCWTPPVFLRVNDDDKKKELYTKELIKKSFNEIKSTIYLVFIIGFILSIYLFTLNMLDAIKYE